MTMYAVQCANGDRSVFMEGYYEALEWGWESNMDFVVVADTGDIVSEHEAGSQFDDYDDSMDSDFDSAMASAGFGMDEDYVYDNDYFDEY